MGGAVVGVRCVGEKLLDNKMSVNNVAKHLRKNTTLKDMSKVYMKKKDITNVTIVIIGVSQNLT